MNRILIACEESQTVTKAFRALGFKAFSCDVAQCSGGHPEWHIQADVLQLTNLDWDLMIAFPPCTDLSKAGAQYWPTKKADGRQGKSIEFFMKLVNCGIRHLAIENPVGIISTVWRKPDQIIQPYFFGESFSKQTCLWLKNLPLLKPTKIVDRGKFIKYPNGKSLPEWYAKAYGKSKQERRRIRSKTFTGIASAMAEQWGNFLRTGFKIPCEQLNLKGFREINCGYK